MKRFVQPLFFQLLQYISSCVKVQDSLSSTHSACPPIIFAFRSCFLWYTATEGQHTYITHITLYHIPARDTTLSRSQPRVCLSVVPCKRPIPRYPRPRPDQNIVHIQTSQQYLFPNSIQLALISNVDKYHYATSLRSIFHYHMIIDPFKNYILYYTHIHTPHATTASLHSSTLTATLHPKIYTTGNLSCDHCQPMFLIRCDVNFNRLRVVVVIFIGQATPFLLLITFN